MNADRRNETFEEVLKNNGERIHYHIAKLGIDDVHGEYYQEGMIAIWNAYHSYPKDICSFLTYVDAAIRKRLRELQKEQQRQTFASGFWLYKRPAVQPKVNKVYHFYYHPGK